MNEIAAEALVPADWVKRETADAPKGIPFKAWPLGDRQRLRGTFNVSNQMLGIRLTELGITPSSGYANNGLVNRQCCVPWDHRTPTNES